MAPWPLFSPHPPTIIYLLWLLLQGERSLVVPTAPPLNPPEIGLLLAGNPGMEKGGSVKNAQEGQAIPKSPARLWPCH